MVGVSLDLPGLIWKTDTAFKDRKQKVQRFRLIDSLVTIREDRERLYKIYGKP